ncbi:esterase [Microbacterium rhizomatis]|uniref:Esterase n=1 Tax=Microbacterium rhizomatis TaxID=1631477 RepID=A0A5J5J7S1_9MICO|nr:esterase [Microbacterium rhizomatis]KAA9111184.1 esterase [Microbacterium rhizomatis]
MIYWLLGLELIDGGILPGCGILTAVLIVVVASVSPRHPRRLLIGALAGAGVAVGMVTFFDAQKTFGVQIPGPAELWAAIGLGSMGVGVAALWSAPWWRRLIAVLLILSSLVLGALGVNRAFSITHTIAAIVGVQAVGPISLPARTTTPVSDSLYTSWTPPAGMPQKGEVGALSGENAIPSPGFAARDASIYLPPAALVADPPPLPLLVFMMGQPGSPEPNAIAKAMDAFAAQHGGLAPITIIADQLSSPTVDPACHDSTTFGAVSTYFNAGIPAWARTHLNIIDAPSSWVIGGYSNGGACATLWGSQHPEIWGNLLDVSGNEFPGSETVDATIAKVFGGDSAAFEAAKPAAVMAAAPAGSYAGHTAVFTTGGDDGQFGAGTLANADAARAAGFTVFVETVPGAGHVGPALDGGLARAIPLLGHALGLAGP